VRRYLRDRGLNGQCSARRALGIVVVRHRRARRVVQRLLPKRPIPERCFEAYYLQRTRFGAA
jgi:hypothetical protein